MKTTNDLHTEAAQIFQGIQAIGRYISVIKAMDDNIYNLASSYDAINGEHPKAQKMKNTIEDLINLNALLLEGFGKNSESLEEMADKLSRDLT